MISQKIFNKLKISNNFKIAIKINNKIKINLKKIEKKLKNKKNRKL